MRVYARSGDSLKTWSLGSYECFDSKDHMDSDKTCINSCCVIVICSYRCQSHRRLLQWFTHWCHNGRGRRVCMVHEVCCWLFVCSIAVIRSTCVLRAAKYGLNRLLYSSELRWPHSRQKSTIFGCYVRLGSNGVFANNMFRWFDKKRATGYVFPQIRVQV